jgi:PAS domain S-box-containing protein
MCRSKQKNIDVTGVNPMQAPSSFNEAGRVEALRQNEVLDTAPEPQFDNLAHLAAQICGTPIAAIILADQERQWLKSRVDLAVSEAPHSVSFCAHGILEPDLLIVRDTLKDERFAGNPLATGGRHLRFYAGAPLVTPEGQPAGALCVIDTVPRHLDETQQDALRRLARQALVLLEARPDSKTPPGESGQARQRSERTERTLAAEPAHQDADSTQFSEERYRRLFEAAKEGILILDAATGKIEDVNPYLCQLLGYAPSDFLGRQLWQIGTFRDIAANQEAFHALQEKEHIRYSDLPLETSDGGTAAVEFISNVYVSGDKKVIQCNIRDMSERKRAAAAVQESQRFLQSTLDALSSHLAVLDEDGKILAVNKAWQQYSGENNGTDSRRRP